MAPTRYPVTATLTAVVHAVRFIHGRLSDEEAYAWLAVQPPADNTQFCPLAVAKFADLLLGQRFQIGDCIGLNAQSHMIKLTTAKRASDTLAAAQAAKNALADTLAYWQRRHVTQNQQAAFAALTTRYLKGQLPLATWLADQRALLLDNPALAELQAFEQETRIPDLQALMEPAALLTNLRHVTLIVPSPLPRLPIVLEPKQGFSPTAMRRQMAAYVIETAKYRAWQHQQNAH